ncbi:hypothetical protein Daus18300_012649 [Diaporthe australafricana]|uniref:DUF7726 domain-containing protein n=1 Tax=Diaporthe australafricana TaxID=127596 RepID=A0ABR3W287_9PEZI
MRSLQRPSQNLGLNQPSGSALTNAQLIDIFSAAVDLEPDSKKSLIGNICFFDAIDENGNGGWWSPKDDHTRGGRLGRDHILSDVPNHFIRDFLLEQIDQGVNQAAELSILQRKTARRALLPDLTADEVKEYSDILANKREDVARAERAEAGIPEEDATPEEIAKCELKRTMFLYNLKNEKQAKEVLHQQEVVKAIDTAVDLTPRVRPGVIRNYEKYGPLRRSVVFHDPVRHLRVETELDPPVHMDWDCDQIRLMIRRFCFWDGEGERHFDWHDTEFDIEEFQHALMITRATLTAFLRKKGPENGDKSQAYELAWEFFKRRELLGYPLRKGVKREGKAPWEMSSSEGSDNGSDDEPAEEVDEPRASVPNLRRSKRHNPPEADPGEESSKRVKTTTTSNRTRRSR